MQYIDQNLLDGLIQKAKASPRKRAHHNLHPRLDDPVQRLCVAIEPETYVRPHRHREPETSEVMLLLRGSAVLLLFDDRGRVIERATLAAKGPVSAAEVPTAAWHTIVSLESGTVFFEVKAGPYRQPAEANLAAWAPAEGAAGTASMTAWFHDALPGDAAPSV